MSQFTDSFFQKILLMEGGYQAHPSDSGNYACEQLVGTKYGIAAVSYQTYTGRCPSEADMKGITLDFARAFYRWYGEFWRIDEVDDQEVYELMFNNFMGSPAQAARALQRALNRFGYALDVDGAMGSKTLAALNSAAAQNPTAVYNAILEEWVTYLYTTKAEFRNGLLNRVATHFPPMTVGDDVAVVEAGGAGYLSERAKSIVRGALRGGWQDLIAVLGLLFGIGLLVFSTRKSMNYLAKKAVRSWI